ncbi:hypothetical protein P9A48_gp73 [Xanthomonas phage Mallos]|uniref:Uncharacterized protein n=1 Tax=Xanthomonas phage Mallos TaxID=2939131 RepID=A0A9E7J5F8_9CAUD|nr:hypothetical protein P9A48_gp73 [Xanthomonas phage Mallos]URA07181.1 hypothetical protein Mallos_BL60073 [Xanthomonas phage Mallos]
MPSSMPTTGRKSRAHGPEPKAMLSGSPSTSWN